MTFIPLDYLSALDAAMSVLGGKIAPVVQCNIPELTDDVRRRIPCWAEMHAAPAALWVEPQVETWRLEINNFAAVLSNGSPLTILVSRPLARMLPERRSFSGHPLGIQWHGLTQLQRALGQTNFSVEASYGFHSALSIGINQLSRLAEHLGRPELGDRLYFAARLRYVIRGRLTALSTVTLLIARKDANNVR